MECRLNSVLEENKELIVALDNERILVRSLQEKLAECSRERDEKQAELTNLHSIVQELQHDCYTMERNFEKYVQLFIWK